MSDAPTWLVPRSRTLFAPHAGATARVDAVSIRIPGEGTDAPVEAVLSVCVAVLMEHGDTPRTVGRGALLREAWALLCQAFGLRASPAGGSVTAFLVNATGGTFDAIHNAPIEEARAWIERKRAEATAKGQTQGGEA